MAFIRVATRQPQPQATARLKLIPNGCPCDSSSEREGERERATESGIERCLCLWLNVLLFCMEYTYVRSTQSERSNKPVKLYLHATCCSELLLLLLLQCPCYKYADAWRKIQQARYKIDEAKSGDRERATHATATTD